MRVYCFQFLQRPLSGLTRLLPRIEPIAGLFKWKRSIFATNFPGILIWCGAPVLYFHSKVTRDRQSVHPIKLQKGRLGLGKKVTTASVIQAPLGRCVFDACRKKMLSSPYRQNWSKWDRCESGTDCTMCSFLIRRHAAIQTPPVVTPGPQAPAKRSTF